MVPARQAMDAGARKRARIELGMQRRGGLILQPVVNMDRDVPGKPRGEIGRELEIVARPAAVADERSRDQEERTERSRGRLLGERVDEDRSANRVTDASRAIVERRELM